MENDALLINSGQLLTKVLLAKRFTQVILAISLPITNFINFFMDPVSLLFYAFYWLILGCHHLSGCHL